MFALPDKSDVPQGSNEEHAIFLEGVTREEFGDLLEWIYKM